MLFSKPRTLAKRNEPISPNGTEKMTANGTEALVETCQNEIDKEDTDGINKDSLRTTGIGFLTCHTSVLVTVAQRQCLFRHFRNHFLHFTGRISFCRIHVGRDGAIQIEAVGRLRTKHPNQCHKLADRSHLRTVALKHITQCLFVQTIFGRCLHHDAVYLTELVVIGDISSTAITAQRVEHHTRRNARTLTLGRIYIYRYLREVHSIRGIRHSHLRTLVQRTQELYHCLVERCHVTARSVLEVQL